MPEAATARVQAASEMVELDNWSRWYGGLLRTGRLTHPPKPEPAEGAEEEEESEPPEEEVRNYGLLTLTAACELRPWP